MDNFQTFQVENYPNYDSNMYINQDELGQSSTRRNRIIQTIVDIIVIIIIFIIFGMIYLFQEPRIRYFTCADTDINFPYKKDTIPFWAVGIYATLAPLIIIILVELVNASLYPCQINSKNLSGGERCIQFFICTFHAISLFVLGISISLTLTETGKQPTVVAGLANFNCIELTNKKKIKSKSY
jgi:hypothetical protein